MKNLKPLITLETLIKLGVVLLLIIAATTNQQYSFYNFVRWTITVSSIYLAYKSYENKQNGLVIYFIATAVLFNPFQKIWFTKEIWHLIDFIIAGITSFTITLDWNRNKKNAVSKF